MQDVVTPTSHLMLLGGERVASASGETIAVENPANRSVVAHVPRAGAEDVDRAVAGGQRGLRHLAQRGARERGRMLLRIAEALEARIEEMARLIALETGNALRTQARPEATVTADIFRYFGGLAGETQGRDHPAGRAAC